MNKIKNLSTKLIAAALSLLIVTSVVAITAYTAGADSVKAKPETASVNNKAKAQSDSSTDGKLSKDETVYVIADAEGAAKKVIVSDWIKNPDKLKTIEDKTNLENIKNVKGEESYKLNDKNMAVWDAQGNDIYYQGNGSKDVPVELKVTYKLNGKTVTPDEIKGKDGRVTIRFDYNNKAYENVNIDGKKEKIYVPFVMLTGMMLDNDKFSNVSVNHGKVINDGNRTIVAGFATPGLEEDLNLKNDEIDFPNYVEIKADAKEFELSTTLTIATSEAFADVDFTKADEKIEELDKKLDKLTDATDKLIDGSSQLYKGISTLLDKSDDLISGVKALANGAKQLSEGAGTLDKGAGELKKGTKSLKKGAVSLNNGTEQLKAGIEKLSSGLGTLSANSSTLNNGAKQVFESLLSTADTSIAAAGLKAEKLTIENYSKVLSGIEDNLSEDSVRKLAYNTAYETVSATVRAQESLIKGQVEAAVEQNVFAAVLEKSGLGMTVDQYNAALAAGQIPEAVQAKIDGAVKQQMASDAIKATIAEKTEAQIKTLIDTNMKSDEVQNQINAVVEKAKAGKTSISTLKGQLDSYNKFYQGILSYTSGVNSASSGAKQLVSGSSQLKSGTNELEKGTKKLHSGTKKLKNGTAQLKQGSDKLYQGLKKLSGGTDALVEGVKKLKDGSLKLNKGLKTYKEEGVNKLVDAVNGDVKGLVNRLKAISKVAANYKSYSGLSSDMDGKVDFIYKTDSIDNN